MTAILKQRLYNVAGTNGADVNASGELKVISTQSGTWNLGTISTVTSVGGMGTLGSILSPLPTGTNTLGNVRIIGNSGATLDSGLNSTTGSIPPTNLLAVGGQYNLVPPALTNGNMAPFQFDVSGNLKTTSGGGSTNTNLSFVGGFTVDRGAGTGGGGTQRVILDSASPLPTGAATSALQTTGNTSLSSIDTKTPALGSALMAGSVPVTMATNQSAIGVAQTGGWNLTQFGGNNIITGTGVGGLGIPRVTVSSDSSLASVATITNALPTGTNILGRVGIDQTTQGTTNFVTGNITQVGGGAVTLAAKTTALSIPVTLPTDVADINPNRTLATAGFNKVTDGTNTASVKASTTVPATTDTALVVTLSPNVATGVTALAKVAEQAHAVGDVGIAVWGVRNDNNVATTTADRQYSDFAVDIAGNLKNVGNINAGVADTGAPLKTGGQARITNPTAVTDGQRVNAMYDKLGKVVIQPIAPRELIGFTTLVMVNNTLEQTITTATAGDFWDVFSITATATGNTQITFRYGTAGTIFAVIWCANNTPNANYQYTVPIPMVTAGQTITAQMSSAQNGVVTVAYAKNK